MKSIIATVVLSVTMAFWAASCAHPTAQVKIPEAAAYRVTFFSTAHAKAHVWYAGEDISCSSPCVFTDLNTNRLVAVSGSFLVEALK